MSSVTFHNEVIQVVDWSVTQYKKGRDWYYTNVVCYNWSNVREYVWGILQKRHMYRPIFLYLMLIQTNKKIQQNTHQRFGNKDGKKKRMSVWSNQPQILLSRTLDTVKRRIQVAVLRWLYDMLDTFYTCLNRVCNENKWHRDNILWTGYGQIGFSNFYTPH